MGGQAGAAGDGARAARSDSTPTKSEADLRADAEEMLKRAAMADNFSSPTVANSYRHQATVALREAERLAMAD